MNRLRGDVRMRVIRVWWIIGNSFAHGKGGKRIAQDDELMRRSSLHETLRGANLGKVRLHRRANGMARETRRVKKMRDEVMPSRAFRQNSRDRKP
ncbi:hypothetical protein PSP6_130044 [Paraburkholderia tropica]|nr:hypothetical protein PSP6_130044 [Paraburkholderia tropica]